MKPATKGVLVGMIVMAGIGAQTPTPAPTPAMRSGVSIEMPTASHAVEVREADEPNAQAVAITANGIVFIGIDPIEPSELNKLSESLVYVKADGRAPYRTILAVLDALHGKSVVLLSTPPKTIPARGYVPPYGTKLVVSH